MGNSGADSEEAAAEKEGGTLLRWRGREWEMDGGSQRRRRMGGPTSWIELEVNIVLNLILNIIGNSLNVENFL